MIEFCQNRHLRFCWCHIIAWCCFWGITLFSFVCLVLALGLAPSIKTLTAGIVAWVNSTLNIPTEFTELFMSAACVLYQSCYILADWIWGLLQPIVLFLDPIFKENTRNECFTILGLSGSVIPAVYNAGTKRTKGILIADMTKYFFPWYGIVMLQNLILSIVGQFVETMDNWKYLLPAILTTTAYSILLVLATGLYERVSRMFVRVYIWEKSCVLRPKFAYKQKSMLINKRALFLKDLSSYIASQVIVAGTPHCNTDKYLAKEIQQIAEFMLPVSERKALKQKKTSTIVDEFGLLFCSSRQVCGSICDTIYYDLPATESRKNFFALQIELACEFWKQLLGSIPNLSDKAHAACRIFCSMQSGSKVEKGIGVYRKNCLQNYHGSLSVMVCGLITYLYKTSQNEATEKLSSNVDYCAEFVHEMWAVFRAEVPFGDDGASISFYEVSLYTEMLFILYALSQIEQYIQAGKEVEDSVKHLLDDFWKSSYVHIGRKLLLDENFCIYLTLARCILRQLPSPANRPLSPEQKKRLRFYALSQKSKIGA